jgi:fatty-acyl-CoA synthase
MSTKQSQYDIGLDKTAANFVPLTPLSFLARSAAVFPNHTSAVYEGKRYTWAETFERCRRFASYLASKGIGEGDTVAAMLPNIPAMNEVHFAVPMARCSMRSTFAWTHPPSPSSSIMAVPRSSWSIPNSLA